MKITLRRKLLSSGRETLYLDFYPPIPHPETGKPTRREFLNLFIYFLKSLLGFFVTVHY